MLQDVILVDEQDRAIGRCDKQSVHVSGELHRAFSVFLFDRRGRWLLQQRHPHKYHSGGLWTNTCCSHPSPGEQILEAAQNRLVMEMGIRTPLEAAFRFQYRAQLDNGVIEHELDHVFVGVFDGAPVANPLEVADWRWVETAPLRRELDCYPERFTYWFRKAFGRVLKHRERSRAI